MPDTILVETLVAWIAVAAALSFIARALADRYLSPLEWRAVLVLALLAAFALGRGVLGLRPDAAWARIPLGLGAALLPLATCLFFEGVQRRHAPLWLKLLATGTTAGALLALPILGWTPTAAQAGAFFALYVLEIAAFLVLLARRDPDDLGMAENELVAACIVVTILALPLGLTEFREALGQPVRAGPLAALILVYVLTRVGEAGDSLTALLWDGAWRMLTALLLTAIIGAALGGGPLDAWASLFTLALGTILLLEVWERFGARMLRADGRGLLRWMLTADTSTLRRFREALRRYPLTEHHLLLETDQLRPYDADDLARAFAAAPVQSAAGVDRERAEGDPLRDGHEQIADLLARYEGTHVCMLTAEPMRLLVIRLPQVLSDHCNRDLELAAIQRLGRVAAEMEPVHA